MLKMWKNLNVLHGGTVDQNLVNILSKQKTNYTYVKTFQNHQNTRTFFWDR